MKTTRVVVLFAAVALMLTPAAPAIDIYKMIAEGDAREAEQFRIRQQQWEEERWLRMSPQERIAEELRRARLERERAREEAIQRELYNSGHRPGTWLYWFRYGG